jgi:hypothetical protein
VHGSAKRYGVNIPTTSVNKVLWRGAAGVVFAGRPLAERPRNIVGNNYNGGVSP